MNTADSKHAITNDAPSHSLLWLPVQLVLDLIHAAWRSFRPYLPQLVPLIVFLITIPILAASSVSAGWFVWRSIAVGWEASLYLQYGCVWVQYLQPLVELNLWIVGMVSHRMHIQSSRY